MNQGTVADAPTKIGLVLDENWAEDIDFSWQIAIQSYAGLSGLSGWMGFGFRPQVEYRQTGAGTNSYECERRVTESFQPTDEYIWRSVNNSTTLQSLVNDDSRTTPCTLFLVTGIKVAARTHISGSSKKDIPIKAGLEADLSPVGATLGVNGEYARQSSGKGKTFRPEPFVLAFSVSNITFGLCLKIEAFNEGALSAIEDDGDAADVEITIG